MFCFFNPYTMTTPDNNNPNIPSRPGMNRRDFIKGMSVAGAASVLKDILNKLPVRTGIEITDDVVSEMFGQTHSVLEGINNNFDDYVAMLEQLGFAIRQDREDLTLAEQEDFIPPELRTRWEGLDDNTMISEISEYLKNNFLQEHEGENHEDPNARTLDRIGTGYFTYALGKIVAQGFPKAAQRIRDNLARIADVPEEERKDLIPHFSRVDFGISAALILLSYESANRAGDHDRIHHLQEGLTETVVASLKVGLDIMLSIFNAKLFEPVVDAHLSRIKRKHADNPLVYKATLYSAIQEWATLGSGFVSTNLGVSMARKFIWEYAKIGEENGQPVYDMNQVYALTAIVADLTGDAAIANPLIAAGDIAPREIALYRLGMSNLQRMSANAIPKRAVNTLVGFPAVVQATALLKRFGLKNNRLGGRDNIDPHSTAHDHETTVPSPEFEESLKQIKESEELAVTLDEDSRQTNRSLLSKAFNHAKIVLKDSLKDVKDAITHYPKMVSKDFEHAGKVARGVPTYNGIPENQVKAIFEHLHAYDLEIEELDLPQILEQFRSTNPVMGAALDKYLEHSPDEFVRQAPKMEHLSEITLLIAAFRKIPGIGNFLAEKLEALQALLYVPIDFGKVEHTIGGTLAEALNILPYQLLNAIFVGGVIQNDFHNFRSEDFELNPLDFNQSDSIGLALQNQNIHIPLMLLSGVADNGFALSILLQILIADGRVLRERGASEVEIDNYLTLEIQKAYDAAQAGGAITMLGCSAHFNNLTLKMMGVAQSAFVGLPSATILFALSCVVNSWAAKNGIFQKLDLSTIGGLSSEGNEHITEEHANGFGFNKGDFFKKVKDIIFEA